MDKCHEKSSRGTPSAASGQKLGSPTVGWSDLALFLDFENLHISADQVYVLELNSKIGTFGRAKFSFSKNHKGLQKLIFF